MAAGDAASRQLLESMLLQVVLSNKLHEPLMTLSGCRHLGLVCTCDTYIHICTCNYNCTGPTSITCVSCCDALVGRQHGAWHALCWHRLSDVVERFLHLVYCWKVRADVIVVGGMKMSANVLSHHVQKEGAGDMLGTYPPLHPQQV